MKGTIRFWLGFLVVLGSVGTVEVTPVLTAAQMWHLGFAIIIGTVIMWSGANALSKDQGQRETTNLFMCFLSYQPKVVSLF